MKTKKLLHAVEDGTQTAVEYLSPYVEQVLREGGELADQTYSRLRPVLKDARIWGARLASDTFDKVYPVIDDALDKVTPAVDATVKRVAPAVEDVLHRIPPTVESARGMVQDDLLPRLADLLQDLARQPLAKELRIAVASAALAKELEKSSKGKRKGGGWRTFGKVLLAGAVLGGVVVALRKLMADPSTGWETHAPKDTAYVADPVADVADAVEDVVEDVVDEATEVVADVTDKVEETTDGIEEKLAKLAEDADGGDASPLADSPYGEGSYVGAEPPEGFSIKGNDRSMKYHVPGGSAYERTIAEVWFDSEDAAKAAGFVRAQH